MKKFFTLAIALVLGAMTNFASAGNSIIYLDGSSDHFIGHFGMEWATDEEILDTYGWLWDEWTNTLTIRDLDWMEYNGTMKLRCVGDMTLKLIGHNTIKGSIKVEGNLNIVGDGFLEMNPGDYRGQFIEVTGDMNISNCRFRIGDTNWYTTYGIEVGGKLTFGENLYAQLPKTFKNVHAAKGIAFSSFTKFANSANVVTNSGYIYGNGQNSNPTFDVFILPTDEIISVAGNHYKADAFATDSVLVGNVSAGNGKLLSYNPVTGNAVVKYNQINNNADYGIDFKKAPEVTLDLSGATVEGNINGVYSSGKVTFTTRAGGAKGVVKGKNGSAVQANEVVLNSANARFESSSTNSYHGAITAKNVTTTGNCYIKGSYVYNEGKGGMCKYPIMDPVSHAYVLVKNIDVVQDKPMNYYVSIGGIPVTKGNCDDVMMDGKIKYVPGETLTFTDVDIACGEEHFIHYYSNFVNLPDLVFNGQNVVTSSGHSMYFAPISDAATNNYTYTIKGSGSLTLNSDIYVEEINKLVIDGTDGLVLNMPYKGYNAFSTSNNYNYCTLTLKNIQNMAVTSRNSVFKGFMKVVTDGCSFPAGISYDTNQRLLMENGQECKRLIMGEAAGIELLTSDAAKKGAFKHLENGQIVIEKDGAKFNAAGARM